MICLLFRVPSPQSAKEIQYDSSYRRHYNKHVMFVDMNSLIGVASVFSVKKSLRHFEFLLIVSLWEHTFIDTHMSCECMNA